MIVLAVVAHPDDEVLGAGGTLAARAASGDEVHVHVLCGRADARRARPRRDSLGLQFRRSADTLGAKTATCDEFQNLHMNTVPAVELVRSVEAAVERVTPEVVYTHYPEDVNDDHGAVFRATLAAVRLPERHPGTTSQPALRSLYAFETPASTDWAWGDGPRAFRPSVFVDITRSAGTKWLAFGAYPEVARPAPHPLSVAGLEARARMRGAQSGIELAEGHALVFRRGLTEVGGAKMMAFGRDATELAAAAGGTISACLAHGGEVMTLLPAGRRATSCEAFAGSEAGESTPERMEIQVRSWRPTILLVPVDDEETARRAMLAARAVDGPVAVLGYASPDAPPAAHPKGFGCNVANDVSAFIGEKERRVRSCGGALQSALARDRCLGSSFGTEAAEGFQLLFERQRFETAPSSEPNGPRGGTP